MAKALGDQYCGAMTDNTMKTWYGTKEWPTRCEKCGGMSHDKKPCNMEGRRLWEEYVSNRMTVEQEIGIFELDYDPKGDKRSGCDAAS